MSDILLPEIVVPERLVVGVEVVEVPFGGDGYKERGSRHKYKRVVTRRVDAEKDSAAKRRGRVKKRVLVAGKDGGSPHSRKYNRGKDDARSANGKKGAAARKAKKEG